MGVQENKNFCTSYVSKVLVDLNGIWSTFETCWCDNLILILFCPFNVRGKEPYLRGCIKKSNMGLCSQTDFFQTLYGDRDHKTLQFDISLEDFDLHSRSHLYEKIKTLVSIF